MVSPVQVILPTEISEVVSILNKVWHLYKTYSYELSKHTYTNNEFHICIALKYNNSTEPQ